MILVDDRTGAVELAPLLGSPNIICRLEFGDFAFSGNGPEGIVDIGIERKGLLDFLQSMTTGRLSGHQMVGLTTNYDWVYLLVEGVWRPDRHTGILQRINRKGRWVAAAQGSRRFMAKDVYNFINTLRVMVNVVTVTTSSKWESAKWLDATHGWWQKEWRKHKSHLQFQKPIVHAQLVKPNLVTRIASQFDGIGWNKAKKIGNHFKLLEDLLFATREDLMEIEGIGPRIADGIIEQRSKK